jgi:hypothetical protein
MLDARAPDAAAIWHASCFCTKVQAQAKLLGRLWNSVMKGDQALESAEKALALRSCFVAQTLLTGRIGTAHRLTEITLVGRILA